MKLEIMMQGYTVPIAVLHVPNGASDAAITAVAKTHPTVSALLAEQPYWWSQIDRRAPHGANPTRNFLTFMRG